MTAVMAELSLPFPPPLSACFTNAAKRGRVKTKRYIAWQQHAMYAAGWQPSLKGKVGVIVNATPPDKRKRDLDNLCKPIMDLLTTKGVIEDDSLVESLYLRWHREGEPGIVVMVTPHPERRA